MARRCSVKIAHVTESSEPYHPSYSGHLQGSFPHGQLRRRAGPAGLRGNIPPALGGFPLRLDQERHEIGEVQQPIRHAPAIVGVTQRVVDLREVLGAVSQRDSGHVVLDLAREAIEQPRVRRSTQLVEM